MLNMLKEFKNFAMRGNVVDMAVGIIIGAAFGKIVDSLVKDIFMPAIGLVLGKVDFATLFFTIHEGKIPGPYASLSAAQAAGATTINLGLFLNTIVSFIIVAFAIFIMIKFMNKISHKNLVGAASTKECPFCHTQIPLLATKCPNCTSDLK